MNKETKADLKQNAPGIILFVVFIIAVIGSIFLGVKEYNADGFCRDKGHDGGNYKAIGDGYYSCRDFTRYNLNGAKKEDGEN